jgi:hypothetical protein
MRQRRRPNGAGSVYIKNGHYYGRWYTAGGGRTNRKLGPVRRPGSASGLTRAQAEKRLRALMDEVAIPTQPTVTVGSAGVVSSRRESAQDPIAKRSNCTFACIWSRS